MTETRQNEHRESSSDSRPEDPARYVDANFSGTTPGAPLASTERAFPAPSTAFPLYSQIASDGGRDPARTSTRPTPNLENEDGMEVDSLAASGESGTTLTSNGTSRTYHHSVGVRSDSPRASLDPQHRCDQAPAFLKLYDELMRERQHKNHYKKRSSHYEGAYNALALENRSTVAALHGAEARVGHLEQSRQAARQEANKIITSLQVKLREVEEQHASLRDSLQVSDAQEPRQVVSAFQALKRSIANVCTGISASATDYIHRGAPDLLLSTQSQSRDDLERVLGGCGGLIVSPSGEGRPIEDFLDYSLRFLLNRSLARDLFGFFHPNLTDDGATLVSKLHDEVYANEPQMSSARFRCSMFSAIDRITVKQGGSQQWAGQFVEKFRDHAIIPLVKSICGSWSDDIFPPGQEREAALLLVASDAYAWHRSVRLNSTAQEFRPTYFDHEYKYSHHWMSLLENHQPTSAHPRVMALVGLGLESLKSLGAGRGAEQVCHEKADVLTEGFF